MCFVSSSFSFFLSFFSSSQQGRLQGALAITSHETCLPSPVGSAPVFCGITFPAPDAASTLLSLNVTVVLCTSPTTFSEMTGELCSHREAGCLPEAGVSLLPQGWEVVSLGGSRMTMKKQLL